MVDKALQTINAVLKNKDIGILYAGGGMDELMGIHGDMWQGLKDYHAKYHSVPDPEVFSENYTDFEIVDVSGPTEYYLDALRAEHIKARTDTILTRGASALDNGNAPEAVLAKVQTELAKLNKFSAGAVDANIMDVDAAKEHYEAVAARAEALGGLPGIPTGIDFIDSAYPSGLSPGDLVVGLGWAQPHSEPILTPKGWVTMGDLKIGDEVIGSNGEPTKVTETHERGTRNVVKVNFSDGTYVFCDKDHLWEVHTAKSRQINGQTKTISTQEMIDNGVLFNRAGRISYKYYMPLPAPVVGEKLDSVVGPYLMGQLLSDGCTVGSSVYLTTNDEQAISIIRDENPHINVEERTYEASTVRRWIVKGGYKTLVIEKGLYAHQKSIPAEYMLATPDERLALLRGLMDGDGSVQLNRRAEYCSTSVRLAEDVAELVRSLGGTAKVSNRSREYKNGEMKVVSIWLPVSPFGLDRKTQKYSPKYSGFKAISSVEVLDYQEPMKCIKVDAEDSLYITRHYTLTHNTGRAKSLFFTLLMCNAHECNFKPMIVSLEMSAAKVRDRVYTIMGKGMFSNSSLALGDVSIDSLRDFKAKKSDKTEFIVVTNEGVADLTPNVVEAKIDQHKPKIVVIDYAQLASDNANSENMTQRMMNQSKEYKRLAVKKQVVIVIISSATAESASSSDEPPTIEQVAWSRQLAYDADLAFAIHKYDDSNLIAVVCRKNRNGPLFAGMLDWDIDNGIIKEVFDK